MNNAYPKWLEHKNLCKQIQWRKEYEVPVKEIGQLLLVRNDQSNQYYKERDNDKWQKALSLSYLSALILVGCERMHTAVLE